MQPVLDSLTADNRRQLASADRLAQNARMAHQATTSYLKDSIGLLHYYKKLAERAMAQCPDEGLFLTLDAESNSIATLVKHMAGNMRSRWTNFLTADGEKPDRNRDAEFEDPPKTREELMAAWDRGWKSVFDALEPLTDADMDRIVTIRSEPPTSTTRLSGPAKRRNLAAHPSICLVTPRSDIMSPKCLAAAQIEQLRAI